MKSSESLFIKTKETVMQVSKRTLIVLAAASVLAAPIAYAQSKDAIRIGVPTALTGPYGDLGEQAKRAMTFAVDQANAAGGVDGRKVEVRFLDTQAKPDMARQQGEKLALSGFSLLMGSIASGEALAMAPMLERWDALYISTINKADAITGASCSPRMFRVNRPDYADAATVKPWLETRKEAKWAIVAADIAWGRNSASSFRKAALETNRQVVTETFPPFGTNDYATYIQTVANSGATALWVALAGSDAVNFATQAKQFGLFDKVFTAGVSFVTDNTAKTLGEASKGIFGIVNYSSTLETPANKKFVADWAKKYPGTTPSNFEGETYIGTQVLFQAIQKAHSVKPADVSKVLSGGTFTTLLGEQRLRKEDHQLVGPNYFGHVGLSGGAWKPIIDMSVPADVATPAPDGSCKKAG